MAPPGSDPGESNPALQRAVWGGLIAVLLVVVGVGVKALLVRGAPGGLPVLGTVPPFELTERSGRAVTRDDLKGEIWIADFIFTRCAGVCPVLTERFARLQAPLRIGQGERTRLVSFSVDPSNDTPAVLRDYAARFQANETGWLFLTGDRATLHPLILDGFRLSVAQRGDTATADPNDLITHSDRFVLVDSAFRIRGYYRGTDEDSVAQLLRDVEKVKREASG